MLGHIEETNVPADARGPVGAVVHRPSPRGWRGADTKRGSQLRNVTMRPADYHGLTVKIWIAEDALRQRCVLFLNKRLAYGFAERARRRDQCLHAAHALVRFRLRRKQGNGD